MFFLYYLILFLLNFMINNIALTFFTLFSLETKELFFLLFISHFLQANYNIIFILNRINLK